MALVHLSCVLVVFSIAGSLGEDPLVVEFVNSTQVDVMEGAELVNFKCHLNRGLMFVLQNDIKMVHVDPITEEETIISNAGNLIEGTSEFYDAQIRQEDGEVIVALYIKKVRFDDDGMYKCKVATKQGAIAEGEAERKIVVHRPMASLHLKFGDNDPIAKSPADPIDIDHGTYTVSCIVEGSNPATEDVHLYLHGQKLEHGPNEIVKMDGPFRKFRTTITGKLHVMVKHSGQQIECRATDSTGISKSVKLAFNVNIYEPEVICNDPQAYHMEENPILTCTVNFTDLEVEGYAFQIGETGEIIKQGDDHAKNIQVKVLNKEPGISVVSLDLHKAEHEYLDKHYYILINLKGGHTSKKEVRLHKVEGISVSSSCGAVGITDCIKTLQEIETRDPAAVCRAVRNVDACLQRLSDSCPDSQKYTVNAVRRSFRSGLEQCKDVDPEEKGHGNRYQEEKAHGNRYQEEKAHGNRYQEEKAHGNRYQEEKAHGNRYTGGYAHSRNEPRMSLIGTYSVVKGATIDLNCTITSIRNQPYPDVNWYKDGKKIDMSWPRTSTSHFLERRRKILNSGLQVESSVVSDAGTYTCRSDSSQKLEKSINVQVSDSAIDGITGPEKVEFDESFILRCVFTNNDRFESQRVEWFKDGILFDRSNRRSMFTNMMDVSNTLQGGLTIHSAMESDSGVYQCRSSRKRYYIRVDVGPTSKSPTTLTTAQSTATTKTTMIPTQFHETTELNKATTNEFKGGHDAQTEFYLSQIRLNEIQIEVELRRRIQLDLEFLNKQIEMGLVDYQDRYRLAEEIMSPLK